MENKYRMKINSFNSDFGGFSMFGNPTIPFIQHRVNVSSYVTFLFPFLASAVHSLALKVLQVCIGSPISMYAVERCTNL